jgi:hypothetical protein
MNVPTPELLSLTEAEYDESYHPFGNPEDSENDIWNHKATLDYPRNCVWSVIEVDDDLFAIPGYHVVNVIGYNVTKIGWEHENIEVRFDNPHDDHEGDCDEQGFCVV